MVKKKNHIQIVAATPSADVNFTEAHLSGDVAIAVGTEQLGLTQKWMESADIRVKIPMEGRCRLTQRRYGNHFTFI
jgi:TrmH family RNA methyltransferase